jgi:ABC-type molybdenum transport system ATPase subunit/photorepair protein PhrA
MMEDTAQPEVIIELKDCTIWQQDHLVLSDVNFSVAKGEFVYLVGKVGSGKSSLIKTLNAQIPLKSGTGELQNSAWRNSGQGKFLISDGKQALCSRIFSSSPTGLSTRTLSSF